jgi:hypothetical protein
MLVETKAVVQMALLFGGTWTVNTAVFAAILVMSLAGNLFAGVIFATSFKRTAQPDRVIGANVAGALLGGLAENSSVVLGFRLLLCVAAGFYLLSAAFGNRHLPDNAAAKGV